LNFPWPFPPTRILSNCRDRRGLGEDTPRHYQNFIDCVKSRRSADLLADMEEGHYSSLLCHLGNIAYRTGKRLDFDPTSESFVDDDDANRYLSREDRPGYELPQWGPAGATGQTR
jgi:hypothetical protein